MSALAPSGRRAAHGALAALAVVLVVACSSPTEPGDTVSSCGDSCLSYEVAAWPMPNPGTLPLPNPAMLERRGDIVRDWVTRLEWSVDISALVTAADADARCASLTLNAQSDYRLPTRIELVSLLDRTRLPTLDERTFPATPLDYFWTSSAVRATPGTRYSVYFGAGETSSGTATQPSAYTRCVRGGSLRGPQRFRIDTDLVTDLGTGLVWQRAASESALSLGAATRFCESATDPPAAPFRLPSEKELQTLIDGAAVPPAALIDDAAFPATPATEFWTLVVDPLPPLVVDFSTGFATVTDAAGTHHVRCVR